MIDPSQVALGRVSPPMAGAWPLPFPALFSSLVGRILLLLGLLAGGCSRSPQPPSASTSQPEIVARVGSHEIRAADVRERMARRAVGDDPARKAALLEEMIEAGALVERARQLGLDQDPALRRSWESLLIARLRELQLEPLLTNAIPTAAQISQYYDTNRARFTEPGQRRGAMLFFELPAKASEERKAAVRNRAMEARAKALAHGEQAAGMRGFGALAVECSEDQASRYRGGDLGWIQSGRGDARLDPAVIEALFQLAGPGATSELIETPRGFYVVRLGEIRPERLKPVDEVRVAIEHTLTIENRKRIEEDWKRRLRADLPVERFPDVLSRLQPPAPAASSDAPPPAP